MNNDIKDIIHKLCEDGHNAMVERRNANRQPIEDISPYEVSYNLIVEEFERLEKENETLRRKLESIEDYEPDEALVAECKMCVHYRKNGHHCVLNDSLTNPKYRCNNFKFRR